MGCEPERVTGYVDGELAPVIAAETERHLWACPACAAQAHFEIALGDRLRSLPEPPLGPELAGRVAAAAARRVHMMAN